MPVVPPAPTSTSPVVPPAPTSTSPTQPPAKLLLNVSSVPLSDTKLATGLKTLAQISMTASGGAASWSSITFNISKTAHISLSGWTLTDESGCADRGCRGYNRTTIVVPGNSMLTGTVKFTPANPQQLNASVSKTYRLNATIGRHHCAQ